MLRRCIFLLAFALASASAQAQFRTIPTDAKRATLGPIQGNVTSVDGKKVLLSPGAQIRDGRNMIVVPNMVPPNLLVKYLLDGQGQLHRIWILSPAEASQPDPKN